MTEDLVAWLRAEIESTPVWLRELIIFGVIVGSVAMVVELAARVML